MPKDQPRKRPIHVGSVELHIGKLKLTLSLEEVRSLARALNDLLGIGTTTWIHYPYNPTISYPPATVTWTPNKIEVNGGDYRIHWTPDDDPLTFEANSNNGGRTP